jgi:sec-independent protein translocase protein TatA
MGIENPVHLAFIAIVALVVLGPKRLPDLARALGNGIKEFRESVSTGSDHHAPVHTEPPSPDAVDPAQQVPSGDAPDRGQL